MSVVFQDPDGIAFSITGEEVFIDAGAGDGAVQKIGQRFTDLIERQIKPLATRLKGVLAEAGPDRVELTLGLAVTGKSGAMLAALVEAGSKAHITVKMSWGSHA